MAANENPYADPNDPSTANVQGPTRKTFDAHKNDDPNAYAGHEVHPNKRDDPKWKQDQKIERNRQQVEDRQKRDEWRERNRKQKESDAKQEKEKLEKEKEDKKKEKKSWRPRGGIELPKQGISRISGASDRLGDKMFVEQPFAYGDAFSMGGELGGMHGSVRSEMGTPDFSGMINMFGKNSRGRGRRKGDSGGISTGFGGYQSPFAGMMGNKVKRGKSLSATGSLTGGIFGKGRKGRKIGDIFSTRLF